MLGNIQQNLEHLGDAEPTRMLVRTQGDTGIVQLLGRRTTIGRTPDNDIRIDEEFISRHHAVVLLCRCQDGDGGSQQHQRHLRQWRARQPPHAQGRRHGDTGQERVPIRHQDVTQSEPAQARPRLKVRAGRRSCAAAWNSLSFGAMTDDYLQRVLKARVYDVAIESPLDAAPRLSRRLGNQVLLKREDLQPVFSFKLRGAYNKIAHLSAAIAARGVICASAGNHAQGVALAARKRGIPALIVMPQTTPPSRCRRSWTWAPRWCCTAISTTAPTSTR